MTNVREKMSSLEAVLREVVERDPTLLMIENLDRLAAAVLSAQEVIEHIDTVLMLQASKKFLSTLTDDDVISF